MPKIKNKQPKRQFYGTIEEKPPTEQKLFALQDQLFAERKKYKKAMEAWAKNPSKSKKPIDGSSKIWSEMLEICFNYSKSMILKRNKGNKFMEPEDVEDKAIDAAISFMNQFLKREDFEVGASFAGLIKFKIVEILYKGREDYHVSLNQIISDDSKTELIDSLGAGNLQSVICSNVNNPEEMLLKESPKDIIHEVLKELDEEIGHDSLLAFKVRLYLTIILRSPKTRHIKRLFLEHWAEDYKTEQVLESTVLEIYNRLRENSYRGYI